MESKAVAPSILFKVIHFFSFSSICLAKSFIVALITVIYGGFDYSDYSEDNPWYLKWMKYKWVNSTVHYLF